MLRLAGAALVAPQGPTTGRQQRRCPRGKRKPHPSGRGFSIGRTTQLLPTATAKQTGPWNEQAEYDVDFGMEA